METVLDSAQSTEPFAKCESFDLSLSWIYICCVNLKSQLNETLSPKNILSRERGSNVLRRRVLQANVFWLLARVASESTAAAAAAARTWGDDDLEDLKEAQRQTALANVHPQALRF